MLQLGGPVGQLDVPPWRPVRAVKAAGIVMRADGSATFVGLSGRAYGVTDSAWCRLGPYHRGTAVPSVWCSCGFHALSRNCQDLWIGVSCGVGVTS